MLDDGLEVGWCVGWVERQANVYFFATALEAVKSHSFSFGPARQDITRAVLDQVGALRK